MDDTQILLLVQSAMADLAGVNDTNAAIAADLHALRGRFEESAQVVAQDDSVEAEDAQEVAEVAQPVGYEAQMLQYANMGLTLGVFVFVALLLNLGVNLWKCFSDKWRS